MHTVTEHRDPPYIEVTVFDRYPDNYLAEFQPVMMRYAAEFDAFSALEVRHGRVRNELWSLLKTGGRANEELITAVKKMKRLAVVGDEIGVVTRLVAALPLSGGPSMRLFKLHELDEARAWMRLPTKQA